MSEVNNVWRPIASAPRDGRLFAVYHPVWRRFDVVNWDAGERHGEPGYSALDPHSGWIIRDGARSQWLWSGECLPSVYSAAEDTTERPSRSGMNNHDN